MERAAPNRRVVVRTPPPVVTRPLDDELVLLNLESETYYGLDQVGTRMLEVLCSSSSLDEAVAQLLTEYEVDEVSLRSDLEALLAQLVENGLVELQEN